MHICCIIASMGPGGAQRVMAQVCNHLATSGHTVTLMQLEAEGAGSFFPLDEGVHLVSLGRNGTGRGLERALRVVTWTRAIRHALVAARPDAVLSFIDRTNIMTLLAVRGLGLPVIVSERTDPAHHALDVVSNVLRRRTYPLATKLVVQTARAARFFAGFPAAKLVVLANPVPSATRHADPARPGPDGRFRIAALGRLDGFKGFQRLIAAFAALASRYPDWDVLIHGQGPDAGQLDAQIGQLGLANRIRIQPPTKDVPAVLATSHLFAFPSRYEGFPNALAEAMAAGLPCVGFRDVSGVEDLIQDGETGLLADFGSDDQASAASLASCLDRLMNSSDLRARLGMAAIARTQAFAPGDILVAWERIILDAADGLRSRI